MQQLRIRNIKSGIQSLENEVKDLKAKLYDKEQKGIAENSEADEDGSDEEEGKDDEN